MSKRVSNFKIRQTYSNNWRNFHIDPLKGRLEKSERNTRYGREKNCVVFMLVFFFFTYQFLAVSIKLLIEKDF